MKKRFKNLLLLLIVVVLSASLFLQVSAETATHFENTLEWTKQASRLADLKPGEDQSTKSGNADVTRSGDVYTLTAKNSIYESGKIAFVIPYTRYAQNYEAKLTITNPATSGVVLVIEYSTSGIVGMENKTHKATLSPGGSLPPFSVKSTATDASTKSSNTVTGTVTIVSVTAVENPEVNFGSSAHGSFTYQFAGGSETTVSKNAQQVSAGSVVSGTKVTLKHGTADQGYSFYCWMANGNILGNTDGEYAITQDSTIYPVYLSTDEISKGDVYSVGQESYMFWHLAISDALLSNETVVLMRNYTLPSTLEGAGLCQNHTFSAYVTGSDNSLEYIVPSGVTLLIPFDEGGTLYTTTPGSTKEDYNYTKIYGAPSCFRKLTVGPGTSIRIAGIMSISGMQSSQQGYNGCPMGPQGFVEVQEGGKITVAYGGILYAWGYIVGAERKDINSPASEGAVEVLDGGTVYECFQVTDWRGGSDSSAMVDGNGDNVKTYKVFPISQYYVQNVQIPMKLNKGAKEFVSLAVTVSIKVEVLLRQPIFPFVGQEGAFLKTDGYIIKDYDEETDRMVVSTSGNVNVSPISIYVEGLFGIGDTTMNSQQFFMPLTNHMTIHLLDGTVTMDQDFVLLPGFQTIIDKNATLKIANGKSMVVFDVAQWDGYVSASKVLFSVLPYAYNRLIDRRGSDAMPTIDDLHSASMLINGTVDFSKGYIYTTSGGANIYSTESGVIKTIAGSATLTYQFKQNIDSNGTDQYIPIAITPAKLLNANGNYVQIETNTYIYKDGVWMPCFMTNVNLGNNLDIYFAILNYDTNISVTLIGPDGKTVSSSLGDLPDGDKIGIPKYKYIVYGDLAAKQMTDTITVTIKSGDKVIDIWSDSIQNYAMRLYNKDTTSEKLKAVIVNMLNYGAACQVQFNYNKDNLANAALGTAAKQYDPKPGGSINRDPDAATISIAARNLKVESNIILCVAFHGNVAGKEVTVTFTGHKGNKDQMKYTVGQDGCIEITGLVVADYNSEITLTFADGTVLTTKLIDYIEHLGGSETNNVFYAFKEFAESAYIYLHSKNTQGGQA